LKLIEVTVSSMFGDSHHSDLYAMHRIPYLGQAQPASKSTQLIKYKVIDTRACDAGESRDKGNLSADSVR